MQSGVNRRNRAEMGRNKKNIGEKPQRKQCDSVLDLLLDMHKHTGLTCQSQISRQQSAFLSIPGQARYPGTSLGPRPNSKPFLTLSPSYLGC